MMPVMAVVYGPEEIAQGLYPDADGQRVAAELLTHQLGSIARQGNGNLSMLIYGSVETRERRSDVDVLMRFDRIPSDSELMDVRDVLSHVHGSTNVHIDAHLVTDADARLAKGTIACDPLFVEQLRIAATQSPYQFGDTLRDLVSITDYPLVQERADVAASITLGFLRHKTDRFLNAGRREGLDIRTMQRGLELPVSIGRKVIRLYQLAGKSGYQEDGAIALRDRNEVERQVLALDVSDRRWRSAQTLVRLNREYSDMLEETIAGTLTVGFYRTWLEKHQNHVASQALRLTLAARQLVSDEIVSEDALPKI